MRCCSSGERESLSRSCEAPLTSPGRTHRQLTELRKRASPRSVSLALAAAADACCSPSGPVDGFSAGLKDDDNLYEWEIMIIGPNGEPRMRCSPLVYPADALRSILADTLYEGGFLRAELVFPPEYPLLPPKMKFITPMWHPNGESACIRSYSAGSSSHSAPLQSTPTATCASPFWCVASAARLSLRPGDRSARKHRSRRFLALQHAPGTDEYGYEDAGERWMPVHTVESIVSRAWRSGGWLVW